MKNTSELNTDIMRITMVIQDKYPALSKYLNEMPVTIPDEKNPDISNQVLLDYRNSLASLLDNYIKGQEIAKEG